MAAKHLGIVCYPKRNFLQASVPVHRREVHLKKLAYSSLRCSELMLTVKHFDRLLSQGLKVGIVEQTETAALKKLGDNRNVVFEREMTHLYTAATCVPLYSAQHSPKYFWAGTSTN